MSRKKFRFSSLLAVALLLLGLGIFLYPAISGFISERSQTHVISNYEEALKTLNDDEKAQSFAAAQAYNEALVNNQKPLSDPFGESGEGSESDENISYMHVGEVIGYIQIPKIGIKAPVYEGTSEDVLQRGIGWLKGSSLPVGGVSTHSVLTGHRGLPTAKLFTDIDRLEKGDEFFIRNSSEILAYEVREIRIIDPSNVAALAIIEGKDIATLLTCHPYMINSERLLVAGERIPYTGQLDDSGQGLPGNLSAAEYDLIRSILIALAAVALIFIVGYLYRRRKKG